MTDSNDENGRPAGRPPGSHPRGSHGGADKPGPKGQDARGQGTRAQGPKARRPNASTDAAPSRPAWADKRGRGAAGGADRAERPGFRSGPRQDRGETAPRRRASPDATVPQPAQDGAVAGERRIRPQQVEGDAAPAEERIAKVIARAGVASRRDAEAMIAEGRVTLNGELVTSPALNVAPDARITVDGEPLPLRERSRLWLFHKPRGLVTTFRDPEGRPTVFEALPEDLPRVVAVGRLDINTEGLLLLTNDGGLARVIAHPETGWLRRYRVRAHGEINQADLDKLRHGITVDGIEYGPVEASLDRVQGDNLWITLGLREGKNREVKRILEHLGLQVNRLIRLSFGPFQLGDLEQGLVEEVRTRVLKDQLGAKLAEEAGVDFDSPVREPIAPFGMPVRHDDAKPRRIRARSAAEADKFERGERSGRRGPRDEDSWARPQRAEPGPGRSRPEQDRGKARRTVWRAGEEEAERAPRPFRPRIDPKAEREASAARGHERVGAIKSKAGRKVLVERLVSAPEPEEAPRSRRDRGRSEATEPRAERPARTPRPPRAEARDDTRSRSARPTLGAKAALRGRSDAPGGESGRKFGARPDGKPGGARGGKPLGKGFGGRSFGGDKAAGPRGGAGGRPGGRPGGGSRPGPKRGR